MRRALIASAFVVTGLAVPLAASAGWPLGTPIDDSALIDITPGGFDLVQALAGSFIPSAIPIPDTQLADEGGCIFGFCSYSYDIVIADLGVSVGINSLTLTPAESVLNLNGDLSFQVASQSAPGTLAYDVTLLGIPLSDTCDLYTDPIDITLEGAVAMELVPDAAGVDVDGDGIPDTKKLDASIPPLSWVWDATDSDIHLDNCGTADFISVLDFFGLSVYGLVLDQITPQIDSLVNSLPATLEPTLEDAFSALTISQSLDLLGVPLSFTLWPETLDIKPEGMRIGMSSVTDVPLNSCVAAFDPGESLSTPSSLPSIGEATSSVPFAPHLAAFIDDDFVNQVLYGVWSGGLLCYDIAPGSDLIPLPLDTSLLNLLSSNAFAPLFPTSTPLEIRTQPRMAPVVVQGPHDVNVEVDQLGLGFITTLDGRKTRMLNVDVKADIGVDLGFDGTTGQLGIALDAGTGAFTTTVSYDEYVPDTADAISTSFGGLFDTTVAPLLTGLIGDSLAFALPGFSGIGVSDLYAGAGGPDGDYVTAWAKAGAVPYASAGCGGCNGSSGSSSGCSSSGCSSSGCSSGCSSSGGPVAFVAFPLVVALLRRRRTS